MMEAIKSLSVRELCDLLAPKGISQDVADNFEEHGIDGETFLLMSDEELKEVAPRIVDRMKLKKLRDTETAVEKENLPPANTSTAIQTPLHQPNRRSIAENNTQSNPQWHLTFKIPENFSSRTEDAITTGLLTKRVRIEIVQSISTAILVHTRNPSSEQYNTLCRKLIERYPTLKDSVGSTGYGSWKTKLRDRFKFLRRPTNPEPKPTGGEPPAKRQKRSKRRGSNTDGLESIDGDVDALLKQLEAECKKKKRHRSMPTIQELTTQLYSHRRQWIQESTPLTADIMKQYPSLKYRKVFRAEFKAIVGLPGDVGVFSLMESWPVWKERIIQYSRLENTHRPKLKKLLVSLDDTTVPEDVVALQLLSELLIAKSRKERLVYFAESSDDLCAFASTIDISAPYLAVCQTSEEITYHVIVEKEPTCELGTFKGALIDLMGSYFIYDIAYPQPLYSLLIMIQHHIFGLEDEQPVSSAVVEIVSSLKNMDNAQ